MRLFIISLTIFVSLSCGNTTKHITDNSSVTLNQSDSNTLTADSNSWQDSFLKLVGAISTGDKKTVKSFFHFTVKDEGNEIWILADSRLVMEIDPNTIKPFTEADFDKYFSSLFTLDLRKTLEKIDRDIFFNTLESTSPEITVVEDSKSKVTTTFDKKNNDLILLLLNTGKDFEYAVQYQFHYTSDKGFKFKQVRVAG